MYPPRSVVVVDDEVETVELFSEMMRLAGYRVYQAHGGSKAIEIISETRPSVVLLDLMMADISGLDLLRQIREDPALKRIPVVVVTALSFSDEKQQCMELGASDYLVKPIAFKDLCKAVEQASFKYEEYDD